MKRLLTSAAMFLCCVATSFAQFSGSGSGTENDPYLILNPIQLNQLRNFLNQENVYFKMMADVDLTEFLEDENPSQGWQPVGTSSAPFKGILDGNGKKVTGFWINRTGSDNVGFFGETNNATIKNFTLKGTNVKGNAYTGFLIGVGLQTSISDCTFEGNVYGAEKVGGCIGSGENIILSSISSCINVTGTNDYIGGIIGYTQGTGSISVCKVICDNITGKDYVGGIYGANLGFQNNLTSCNVYSTISGDDYVGGICGYVTYNHQYSDGDHNSSDITSCSFWGNINANSNVGGISGEHSNKSKISNCSATCQINATGDCVGGIVGNSLSRSFKIYSVKWYATDIINTYFSGAISGRENIGGIVGLKRGGLIKCCISISSIIGNGAIGGICGKAEEQTNDGGTNGTCLYSNVNKSTYIKSNDKNVGRIIGLKQGNGVILGSQGTPQENKAYNQSIVISQGVALDISDDLQNGTGVSNNTLKLKATYVAMGWDFTDTWEIQETECYPYFKTQTAPPVIQSQVVSGATVVSGKCVSGATVTLDIDGVKQEKVFGGTTFTFNVDPLQAGHEIRVSAKADGKEQSYFTTEVVSFLGKGTESDPYQISTAADLTQVYRKGYYKLMNDIDLTSYINQYYSTEGWESIGRDGSETVYFDGNNHKVTGLWCNSTRDNTGLFSCFANGYIKNLTVETASGKQVKGGANTGILIGKLINGTIENCKVSGSVADGTPVGGIVGLLDGGQILLSQANVTIKTTGDDTYVGGLVGEITSGEIDQCVTLGSVTATGTNSQAGGLVGKNAATVTNCYSNASVTSAYCAAGLIAYNYGLVEKCYATGNLSSQNYGAGVIGYNDGANAIIRNCVALNNKIDVTYESQSAQSGGYGQRIIGGIKNGAPAPELSNYALKTMQVSVNNVPQKVYDDIMNGVAKTSTELVRQTTYQELGWDFTNTWTVSGETEGYPSLKNNEASVVMPEDDEPVISNDDIIRVANVDAYKGKNVAVGVTLINKSTDLRAYQFDLTLPSGISLAKDGNGNYLVTKTNRYEDEDQALQVTLLENNTYRFVSYSTESKKITGTSGALLNIILNVASTHTAGTFEANIDNTIFTKINGTQIKLNSAKFNIVVHKAMLGDANGDGEINVGDIVEIVKDILHKTTSRFVREAADVNEDGEINVTDIVLVANIIMGGNPNASRTRGAAANTLNDALSLCQNDNHSMSLLLRNEGGYVASQFELRLSEGQKLESISMNGERRNGHQLDYYQIGDNTYQVVAYSINNQSYSGNDGELLNIKTYGSGDVEINNILFVTESFGEKRFSSLQGGGMTGIDVIKAVEPFDIYSVDGRVVRRQAVNTEGLQKGIYIIKGKKQVVR